MKFEASTGGLAPRPGGWAVFFALYPPPDVLRRITAVAAVEGLNGPRVAPERLHMSLLGLGRHEALPGGVLDRIRAAATTIEAASFVVSLNHLISFATRRGPHPRVLLGDDGVVGVHALREALHQALGHAGLVAGPPGAFEPHLTLSREPRRRPEVDLEPVSWRVRDFRLIASAQGAARHDVLGTWPLEARPLAMV